MKSKAASHQRTCRPSINAADASEQLPRVLWLLCAAVAVLVLAAYWPALSAGALIFDDDQYLINNPLVQKPGWESTKRFLTEVLHPSTVAGYYQPLAMISLMLDCAWGGSPDNLYPFHCTSLGLHIANSVLVVILMQLLFRHPWAAAGAGLVFGLHPITVESIPWVAERKTLLDAFFSLACLVFYVRHARKPGPLRYLACLVFYILALMSKPTSLPLPALLLILDFWPLCRFGRRAIVEKLPFFAIAGVFALIAFLSQAQASAVVMPGEYRRVVIPLVVCHNIVFYLWKVLWPIHPSAFYPHPRPIELQTTAYLIGVVGAVVLLPALLASLRWARSLLCGWLFFFVGMLPTMGIVGFANTIAADRFAYFPMVGLLMILTQLISRASDASSQAARPGLRRGLIAAILVAVAVAEAGLTRRYLAKWKDSSTLYAYMVNLAPESEALRYNYAEVLARRGQIDEAIFHYTEAIRINPIFAEPHVNLGILLLNRNQPEQALPHFEKAFRLEPGMREARINLVSALLRQAENRQLAGRYAEAVPLYEQALSLEPNLPVAHHNMAAALLRLRRTEEAIRHFSQAVRLEPDNQGFRKSLTLAIRHRSASTAPASGTMP